MQKTTILLIILCGIVMKVKAQKGYQSVTGGLLVAVSDNSTTRYNGYEYSWGTGPGLDVTGQSNITDKSALLLQLQVTAFKGSSTYTSLLKSPVLYPVSLKVGYRYQFTASGFYANVLAGAENASGTWYLPAAVGMGKRIPLKEANFIDAGIDFTGGFVSRFNIKVGFSLWQNE
jgi:hypothetical protein